jgi:tetratricopeptide (TPR) repeat protein
MRLACLLGLMSLIQGGATPPAADPKAPQNPPVLDSLALKDGRFFEGKPVKKTDKGFRVQFENGEVFVPADLVKDYYSSSFATDYTPKDEDEKQKLEQGLIPVSGKWVPKKDLERDIQKRNAAAQKRIAEAKKHSGWADRYRAESKHFKFEHQLPPELFEEFKNLLETYYDVFTKKWGLAMTAKTKPLVCIYIDEQQYYRTSGAPRGAIGFFWFTKVPVELDLYWDRLDPRQTIDVLFHEGNHLLTHMVNEKFRYPAWINESMAEYFGASRWDPVKKHMSIGHLQAGRLMVVKDAIKKNDWLKLKDMIEMERFQALHYAWGWTFIHFVMSTEKYKKNFERFYLDLANKTGVKRVPWQGIFRTVEPALQIEMLLKYLAVKDLDVLQREWYDYIKELEVNDALGFDEAGRLMRQMGSPKKAAEYLARAVELGTKNAATFAVYGEVLTGQRKYKEAIEMLDRATSLDPLTAKFWFAKGGAYRAQSGEQNKETGLKLIKLAAEMDPEDTEIQFYIDNMEELAELLEGKGKEKGDK